MKASGLSLRTAGMQWKPVQCRHRGPNVTTICAVKRNQVLIATSMAAPQGKVLSTDTTTVKQRVKPANKQSRTKVHKGLRFLWSWLHFSLTPAGGLYSFYRTPKVLQLIPLLRSGQAAPILVQASCWQNKRHSSLIIGHSNTGLKAYPPPTFAGHLQLRIKYF